VQDLQKLLCPDSISAEIDQEGFGGSHYNIEPDSFTDRPIRGVAAYPLAKGVSFTAPPYQFLVSP